MVGKCQNTGAIVLKAERTSSPSPWPTGAATYWSRKSTPCAPPSPAPARCTRSPSTPGSFCQITSMRYGHCRRMTPIFRQDGPSSSAVFRQELPLVKADLPPELPRESGGSGRGDFGNIRYVMKLISGGTSIMSISTRSSMGWLAMLGIGRFHRSGGRWRGGIIQPIGEAPERLPANLVRDRIDGGRRKRWGAKEHPTLRLAGGR